MSKLKGDCNGFIRGCLGGPGFALFWSMAPSRGLQWSRTGSPFWRFFGSLGSSSTTGAGLTCSLQEAWAEDWCLLGVVLFETDLSVSTVVGLGPRGLSRALVAAARGSADLNLKKALFLPWRQEPSELSYLSVAISSSFGSVGYLMLCLCAIS